MPYIEQGRRSAIVWAGLYGGVDAAHVASEGELNFAITYLINTYVEREGKSYKTFNAIIGALECAKLEMYARRIRPYEDRKKEENGDVYPSDS